MKHKKTYKKIEGSHLRYISTKQLIPPHPVTLLECKEIINSLKKNGWSDRPLIGFKVGNKIKCITGSHRIFSAKKVKLDKVPVQVINKKVYKRLLEEYGLTKENTVDVIYVLGYISGRHIFKRIGLKDLDKLMMEDIG